MNGDRNPEHAVRLVMGRKKDSAFLPCAHEVFRSSSSLKTEPTLHLGRQRVLVAAAVLIVFCKSLVAAASVVSEESSASLSQESPASLSEVCVPLRAATVRLICGTDFSSGVIVTGEGHILSVSHGLPKDLRSATVVFFDGVTADADILLRDPDTDVAVLKLKSVAPARDLKPVSTGPFGQPVKGLNVIAAGYPGREKSGFSPVMRLGELLAAEATVLRSSCTLTAGDSGGPLIDLSGRLIGLHRQIGLGAESNHHIPIERIVEVIKPLLDLSDSSQRQPVVNPGTSALPRQLPVVGDAVTKTCRQRTVEIFQGENQEGRVLGTLLNQEWVVTKLSELTPEVPVLCRFHDGSQSSCTIIKSNVALDMCLLKLEMPREGVAPLESTGTDEPGLLYSPMVASTGTAGVLRFGLLTRVQHAEPVLVGKLGAVLEIDDVVKVVRVKDVAPNSTAGIARLQTGDQILAVNQQSIGRLDDVGAALNKRQPGDWLSFQFERDTTRQSAFARFQHDPGERFERTEFLDGRSGRMSERRSGFEDVFQHDAALMPNQCGGPLCDLSGRIIAINIARRARESTLAIPLNQVLTELQSEP